MTRKLICAPNSQHSVWTSWTVLAVLEKTAESARKEVSCGEMIQVKQDLHPSKHQKHTPEVAKERLPRSLDSWLAWSDQHNQATIRVDLGIFAIWQKVPKYIRCTETETVFFLLFFSLVFFVGGEFLLNEGLFCESD